MCWFSIVEMLVFGVEQLLDIHVYGILIHMFVFEFVFFTHLLVELNIYC